MNDEPRHSQLQATALHLVQEEPEWCGPPGEVCDQDVGIEDY
jgi:hypothetical protein